MRFGVKFGINVVLSAQINLTPTFSFNSDQTWYGACTSQTYPDKKLNPWGPSNIKLKYKAKLNIYPQNKSLTNSFMSAH